jgi:hypothetical protein
VQVVTKWRPPTGYQASFSPSICFLQAELRGLGPQVYYTDRRMSGKLVPTFADRGCRVVSATDPHGRTLGFLDRSRYYFFPVAPHLYSRGWVDPVPDPLLLRKSGSAGNRTRNLWICSQELWPLDHRGGLHLHTESRTKIRNIREYARAMNWWWLTLLNDTKNLSTSWYNCRLAVNEALHSMHVHVYTDCTAEEVAKLKKDIKDILNEIYHTNMRSLRNGQEVMVC